MERAKAISKSLERIYRLSCSLDTGWILPNNGFLLKFSTEEPVQGTSKSFYKGYGAVTMHAPPGRMETYSPSRSLKAVLRAERFQENSIEIWDMERLRSSKSLKSTHAQILAGQTFGGLVWSSDEQYIAYIAEDTPPRSGSFWTDDKNPGKQHEYKEEFGEGFGGSTNPALFIYSLQTQKSTKVNTEQVYPAQVCFKPHSHTLVFVGYKTDEPYKTSLATLNRETGLFAYDIDSGETQGIEIAQGLMGGLYPKFNPSGQLMAYYGVPTGTLTQCFCMPLYVIDWETKQSRVLIDVVKQFTPEFNGLYGYQSTIMRSQWLNDELFIFQTLNRVKEQVYSVNTQGQINTLPVPLDGLFTAGILDIFENKVLISASSVKVLPQAYVAEYSNGEWTTSLLEQNELRPLLPSDQEFLTVLSEAKSEVIQHEATPLESILYYTKRENPLIVQIHGGPHGGITSSYSTLNVLRLSRNFNVLVCNYRGSTGFGQHQLEALLGGVGEVDVADVLDAIQQSSKFVDTSRVFTYGTSHGGSLSALLATSGKTIGAVIVNGALNIASNAYTSDDPSWPFTELMSAPVQHIPDGDTLQRFYGASAISQVAQVTIPILLVVGGNDKCVSPDASIGYYRALKSLGRDVRMLYYERDGHAIASRPNSYDFTVNGLLWMEDKLS